MKFLLVPGNNSLSHIAKCLSLEAVLTAHGHSVLIAVARKHAGFMRRLKISHTVLPDIQESDDGALPDLNWFRSVDFLQRCIQAEIDLIKAFRPHRVVGIFRFTLKASAAACGVSFDAVACGCMMPDVEEVLGFGPGDTGVEEQRLYLTNFYRFTGRQMGRAMTAYGLRPVADIRSMLEGDRTFLWDLPQFMPLPEDSHRFHIGPLFWKAWPESGDPPLPFEEHARPLALIALGTRKSSRSLVCKAANCLLKCGYNVMIACGGQSNLLNLLPDEPRLRTWYFAPLQQLLCRADLVVSHGGQMTIFEALQHGVPLLVIPSQPEQAHNGVCLERIVCGRRLAPPVAFKGQTRAYVEAFTRQSDARVMEIIMGVAQDKGMAQHLDRAQAVLDRYNGPAQLAEMLEET